MQDRDGPLVMGPQWAMTQGFGTCCGYPITGENPTLRRWYSPNPPFHQSVILNPQGRLVTPRESKLVTIGRHLVVMHFLLVGTDRGWGYWHPPY
jgi:hypothetical protein